MSSCESRLEGQLDSSPVMHLGALSAQRLSVGESDNVADRQADEVVKWRVFEISEVATFVMRAFARDPLRT